MPLERLTGRAFGPGFASTGAEVPFDVSDFGLSLVTEEGFDGRPAWKELAARRAGFNNGQLMLEWSGRAGRYALAITDPAAIETVAARLGKGGAGRPRARRADLATRTWSQMLVWFTVAPFVLAIVLLVALVWQHDRVAAWAVSHVPIEQEKKLGAMVFEQARARLKPVTGEPERLVRELGARLTRGSAYTYEFHVVEDATVNAFAMPGGYIVVHSGLLALADRAEEVAGVLAHEVQHVEKRHSLKGMAKGLGLTALVSMVFGDLGALAGLGQELIGLKFSRAHETEADMEGLRALVAAGIAPSGMRDFFRKLGERQKLDLGWLSSHPALEDRHAAIDAAIKALPAEAREPKALAYDYAAIKAALPRALPAPKDKP